MGFIAELREHCNRVFGRVGVSQDIISLFIENVVKGYDGTRQHIMRWTTYSRDGRDAEIIRLKKTGVGYNKLHKMTGLTVRRIRQICAQQPLLFKVDDEDDIA